MTAAPKIGWIPSSPDPRMASARLRCSLPSRYLRESGWNSEIMDEQHEDTYDVVVFQKVYDARRIELAARLRKRAAVTVFDLCDNHFYNPDGLPALAERADRLQRMLDLVTAVSVSTRTLAELLSERDPTVIDDALDPFTAPLLARARARVPSVLRGSSLRLVWFGNAGGESPSFGLTHLARILPALEDLHARQPLRLTVVSNSRAAWEGAVNRVSFPSRYVEWSPASFARAFPGHDICVVPIEPNPFTICKTGNRVALSLKLGVPVIADPIPSFEEFAPFILLGNWPENLERYASDPALRESHVSAGRRHVEATYTPERVVDQWSALFNRLLTASRTRVPGTVAQR